MDELDHNQEIVLSSVLDNLPLAPLPRDFVQKVMAQVEDTAVTRPLPVAIRFRLQFIDVALALFFALILSSVWLIGLWWKGILNAAWLPPLNISWPMLHQLIQSNNPLLFVGIGVLVLEIILLGVIGANVLQSN